MGEKIGFFPILTSDLEILKCFGLVQAKNLHESDFLNIFEHFRSNVGNSTTFLKWNTLLDSFPAKKSSALAHWH